MPVKGDDFDSIIADENIEHLSNIIATITPKGATHPSTATACVKGIYKRLRYEAGGQISFKPTFVFKTGVIKDPLTQIVLTPKRDDQMTIKNLITDVSENFTVKEAEVESSANTRLILQSELS